MHERALDETARIAEGVRSDELDLPTPCTQWDVRALLNHMVGGNLRFAALAEGTPLTRAAAAQDLLGDNPSRAYRESAEAMKRAWRQPGRLEGMYELPIGVLPGQAALTLRLNEAILHGWDLARATGQPADLDGRLAAHVLGFAEQALATPESRAARIGPSVPVAADASVTDRLVAFLGRQP
jgi:uncharacterized protein (TIGR03086 family)